MPDVLIHCYFVLLLPDYVLTNICNLSLRNNKNCSSCISVVMYTIPLDQGSFICSY